MKHLLSGTVLAAVLALAIPAWAQSPAAPDSRAVDALLARMAETPPAASEAAPTKAKARTAAHARASHRTQMKHATMRMHHPMHRMGGARMGMGPGDNDVADQLNHQEVQRMSDSSMPPAGYPTQQPGYAPPPPSYQGR
jgi:choline dehydrogenase-like flavoprotein